MNFSKIWKFIVLILLLFLLMFFISQNVFADDSIPVETGAIDEIGVDDVETGESDEIKTGGAKKKSSDLASTFSAKDSSKASKVTAKIISMIINIAQIIGAGVAIIMLVVLAIQYISASPNGRAEIKKNSTLYVLGAIIIFAASGILGIIRRFAVLGISSQA